MASKPQRKSAKRSATKPARVAVAPGKKKLSPRKTAKAARKAAPKKSAARKPAKKAPAKKLAAKKAAPRKAAVKKTSVKKAPAKKAAARKAAPRKAVKKTPARKPPVKAVKKATPRPKAVKAAKAAPVRKVPVPRKAPPPARAAKPARPPKAEPPTPPRAEPEPAVAAAPAPPVPAGAQAVSPAAAAPVGPRKRGRKRRDPLDDLLKPEKRRPGRPRKRSPLAELMPKRPARLRKRPRGRRTDEDGDILVAPRPPAPRDTMSLEAIRADVLARYLRGETPPCPVGCGGMAQVVRVSTTSSGAGEIWLECLSCAQRERFEVPAATEAERDAIFATLDAGNDPGCPRHERWIQLRRRGRDTVCPECGILIQGR